MFKIDFSFDLKEYRDREMWPSVPGCVIKQSSSALLSVVTHSSVRSCHGLVNEGKTSRPHGLGWEITVMGRTTGSDGQADRLTERSRQTVQHAVGSTTSTKSRLWLPAAVVSLTLSAHNVSSYLAASCRGLALQGDGASEDEASTTKPNYSAQASCVRPSTWVR
ncbi:hypothetical protein RRG08_037402 [Elysia crispata]|uniref:Uncharacterized protein n=1 Tax=Elysia crispata TaxID=231223 RepID=A0AAE1AG03_9GAST|nr:hypothetical protein RRG08_037402 [Elysia crispata]